MIVKLIFGILFLVMYKERVETYSSVFLISEKNYAKNYATHNFLIEIFVPNLKELTAKC